MLEKIYTDLSDTIRIPSVGNCSYYLTFTYDFSRYTTVYLLRSKEDVCDKFIEFKALVENKFDRKIKKLRSDNGTEYKNHRFRQVTVEAGIEHEFTENATPEQNGVSERMNRAIGNSVRSVLIDSKLPVKYWTYAVQYVVQMRNVSRNSAIGGKIPYEIWNGKDPDYNCFYPFGCDAIAY